jgi:TonB family protein
VPSAVQSEPANEEMAIPRPNPVPLETPVSVTGAKATTENSSRDLFSEETNTVLVFRDGAVIRLAAPVSVGQLIFLTLKKSNQEVVCQVLRKREATAGQAFVELQFTEARSDYWGVPFPQNETSAPPIRPPAKQKPAVKYVAPVVSPIPPAEPRHQDVGDQLKVEVDALREQLLGLEKKKRGDKAKSLKEELADVNAPSPVLQNATEEKPELLMPPAQDNAPVARAVISMALPTEKKVLKAELEQSAEDALPEPELDFSQVPENHAEEDREPVAVRVQLLSSKARVMALGAALVLALASAAWYGKLWQYLQTGKKTVAVANAARPLAPRTVANAANATKPATPASEQKDSPKQPANASSATANDHAAIKPDDHTPPGTPKKAAREESAAKDDTPDLQPASNAPEIVPSDAPVFPAKLLKAANPVYPPDAMTNYITGDVKAEVTVDPSGHVEEVKVISGPQALRDAAVAALKQYQYAPATLAGKSVVFKATEVVKFWFNP